MLQIGITGGIGAGKSTVASIFELLGIPIYQADVRAKQLMLQDELRKQVVAVLGTNAYGQDGQLNRSWIATVVFSDRWMLNKLNAVIHPAVERDYQIWHRQQEGAAYTLKEAALIFDTGGYLILDAVIVVTAEESVRIDRVSQRDGLSVRQVKERVNQQWPEHRRIQLADYLIDNSGHTSLINQVVKIHQSLSTSIDLTGKRKWDPQNSITLQ